MDAHGAVRWTGLGGRCGRRWMPIVGEVGRPMWTEVDAHCGRGWAAGWTGDGRPSGRVLGGQVDGCWAARWTDAGRPSGRGWTPNLDGHLTVSGLPREVLWAPTERPLAAHLSAMDDHTTGRGRVDGRKMGAHIYVDGKEDWPKMSHFTNFNSLFLAC